MGRPSTYSDETASAICERLATYPHGLYRLLDEDDEFPSQATVYRWLEQHDDFRENLTRARERQAEYLIFAGHDQLAEVDPDDGNGNARVAKARALAEYRGKMAGWIAPRKYGAKVGLEHSTPPGKPLELKHDVPEEIKGKLAALARDAARGVA